MAARRGVVCVSWDPALAATRQMLLESAGLQVTTVVREEALAACNSAGAKLLILGHSVPREKKRNIIKSFRRCCDAPVLSLLEHHQSKLPEADYGVRIENPDELIATIRTILSEE